MGKLIIAGATGIVALAAASTATLTGIVPGIGPSVDEPSKEAPVSLQEQPEKIKTIKLFDAEVEKKTEVASVRTRDDIVFCMTLRGDGEDCLSRKELLAEKDQPLMRKRVALRTGDQAGADIPMKVMLAHPTDYKKPAEEVRDCSMFNQMKQEGWGAITSADMADEQWFMARCGLFLLAERADLHNVTNFTDERLAVKDLEALAPTAWPYIGETEKNLSVKLHRPASNVTRQNADRFWVSRYGDMRTLVSEIAHADFDEDGVAEVLVLMNGQLVGGTARLSAYGLVEKDTGQVTLAPAQTY